MWSTALLLVPLAVQTPTPRMIEGISNGDFEYMWLPDNPSNPVVDGAFWVGGETRTVFAGGTRFLRFKAADAGERVFQRVSCGHGKEDSLTLNAKARIAVSGDAALVTLVEGLTPGDGTVDGGTENQHAMVTVLSGCGPYDGWRFTEQYSSNPPEPIDACPEVPSLSGNVLNSFHSTLSQGSMTALWEVHHDGNVRIVLRARNVSPSGGTPSPVHHEWHLVDPVAGDTLLAEFIVPEDNQGQTFIARTPVLDTQQLRLKVTLLGTDASIFEWHASITYEGRRLTYRFSDMPLIPVDTDDQKWIYVNAGVGSWTQIPASVQDVGEEFNTRFGSYPFAPVEVELSSAATNANRVDFDDVSLMREFDHLTAAELRIKAVREGEWVRDNWKAVRDRSDGQVGPESSKYMVPPHKLMTETPPVYSTVIPTEDVPGAEPYTLRTLLLEYFGSPVDYDDFFSIKEEQLQHIEPLTGMLYEGYDVFTDQWLEGNDKTTSAGVMGEMVSLYERTNDVTYLDVAFSYGEIVHVNGVYSHPTDPQDPHNGLLLNGPFTVIDGNNPDVDNPLLFDDLDPDTHTDVNSNLGHFNGTLSLIAAYVACRNYNLAHPGTPRYDPNQLANWLQVIKTSAVTGADMKIYSPMGDLGPTATWGDWTSVNWEYFSGYFSDMYGYMGGTVTGALDHLAKLPTPLLPDEAATQHALRNDFLLDGAERFISDWEQATFRNEQAAGDVARTWELFAWLAPYLDSINNQALADRFRAQVARAAEHALRFQYFDGYWVAAGQDEYQELAGNTGGVRFFAPPGPFPTGMSQVFRVDETASVQDDWLAILNTIFDVTKTKFRRLHGYQMSVLTAPNDDELAGAERFIVENYLFLLGNIPQVLFGFLDEPTASISPPSLSPAGPSGQTFQFVFTVPTGDLQTALDERTRVLRWKYVGNPAVWQSEVLWPLDPSFFAAPVLDSGTNTITLTTNAPVPPGSGPFKFDAHTWDPDGQWERDTSYQRTW